MSDNFWQLLCAVLGGSGLWELLKFEIGKHRKKLSDEQKLILGIAHDRIWYLGGQYLRRAETKFDANHIDKAYVRIDGGTSNPGYFTAKAAPTKASLQG